MIMTLGFLGTALDVLLVVLGFGLIIFIHELGHFLAARWAGIRVLAFAVGFGPALCSFRKGVGFKAGTTEPEYLKRAGGAEGRIPGISPTEYRLNVLPFGGYVKMLGQEDTNPAARSGASDSYQSVAPWKRMVVISAGVVMNLITAAALFIVVFLVGLRTEPPVIGGVQPGSPAAVVVADNPPPGAAELDRGLRPGDRVARVNGRRPNSFNDLVLATAMGRKGDPIEFEIERPGVGIPLFFRIIPEIGDVSGLLELGIEPARAAKLVSAETPNENKQLAQRFADIGFPELEPGMELVSVEGRPKVVNAGTLFEAVRESDGTPVRASFKAADGALVVREFEPMPELQIDRVRLSETSDTTLEHLLGLTPVMSVGPFDTDAKVPSRGYELGLREGDVFTRLGGVEFPNIAQGIAEIRAHAGRTIAVSVLRRGDEGAWQEVTLDDVTVDRKGMIGFAPVDTAERLTLISLPPRRFMRAGESVAPAALEVIRAPGMTVATVNGTTVDNFSQLRAALKAATRDALAAGRSDATVTLGLRRPVAGIPSNQAPIEEVEWQLDSASLAQLHQLKWRSPLARSAFEPEQFLLKAETPGGAIGMGLAETRRVMLMTYVTFARLFEGTVRVEHLKGPVGIAHLGTIIADRGLIWLLFFMALISVNLAVINFLPLPIVDGGQFLFIVYEQVMGKPVSIAFQNAATLAGLVLIGSLFIIVTFNDVVNLFNL